MLSPFQVWDRVGTGRESLKAIGEEMKYLQGMPRVWLGQDRLMQPCVPVCLCRRTQVWLRAAQKPLKRPGWWKGKFYFILDAGNWGWGGSWTPVQRPIACTDKWVRACIDRGRGLFAKHLSQLWQSSWNWSSVIWPVLSWLSAVNLLFQDLIFFFHFLRPVLRTVAAYVMAAVWSSRT